MSGRRRLVLTLGAVGFLAAAVLLLALLEPAHAAKLPGYMAVAFTVAGKFIVLAPALGEDVPYSPYYLATMIALMDVATALFVVTNLDVLFKLPWLGKRLKGMEENGRRTLELNPWYKRWAAAGVAVFVMFPLTGTGAIGGTIFGRLIGLWAPSILGGITAGAAIGSYGMALGADGLARVLAPVRDTLGFKIASGLVVTAFLAILVWQALKPSPAPRDPGPGAPIPPPPA